MPACGGWCMRKMFSMPEIAGALGTDSPQDAASLHFDRVSTDTRSLRAGDLFVALKGKNYNGHDFLKLALEKGASAFVLSEKRRTGVPTLFVEDTAAALGRLGSLNRLAWQGDVLAVTGSFGKTTVKDMLNCMLSGLGKTFATKGNLNNHLGVPMTLLRLGSVSQDEHAFAIIELGADKPGEIDYCASLVKPNVAVITGVGSAHLSGFGNRDGVAEEKAKILRHLTADGVAVVPAESPYDALWRQEAAGRRIIRYGKAGSDLADVEIEDCRQQRNAISFVLKANLKKELVKKEIFVPVLGVHNCHNAAAAFAAILALGENKFRRDEPAKSLEHYGGSSGRLQPHTLGRRGGRRGGYRMGQQGEHHGGLLIDDSYNANPDSVREAMHTLASFDGYKILVLGDMLELGAEEEEKEHRNLGDLAAELGLDEVLAYGKLAGLAVTRLTEKRKQTPRGKVFGSKAELTEHLLGKDLEKMICLVKGSRGAGMETVVAAILAKFGDNKK